MDKQTFQQKIYSYFTEHGRTLPWRRPTPPAGGFGNGSFAYNPYNILVSEVMLQQTQVSRVVPKYKEWLEKFPTVQSLAEASLRDVLVVWQGLGYNRRGKYLREAAEKIVKDNRYDFLLCHSRESGNPISFIDSGSAPPVGGLSGMTGDEMVNILQQLPGIGHATAAAIVAYAFNKSVVFIETNIRTVYLYFYFKKDQQVSDKQVTELVEKTLDFDNPRDWYYALTDYGNMLKSQEKFKNTQSKHYAKQSKFEGSTRQLRGRILKTLIDSPKSIHSLVRETGRKKDEISSVLRDLAKEEIIQKQGTMWRLRDG